MRRKEILCAVAMTLGACGRTEAESPELPPAPSSPAADPVDEEEPPPPAPVPVERILYRVRMSLPPWYGRNPVSVFAELRMDVGENALRVRFEGDRWPLRPGAEVRYCDGEIYGSEPNAHLDATGVSRWFSGGVAGSAPLRIPVEGRPDRRDPAPPPDSLVCTFLADWAGEPRGRHRCARPPERFSIGRFRADQTARVRLRLPPDWHACPSDAAALEATGGDENEAGAFLSAEELSRIAGNVPSEPRTSAGLSVHNPSDSRVVIVIEGSPIGWVGVGSERTFEGLTPGRYTVAAIRPMGDVLARPRSRPIPGAVVFPPPASSGSR